MEADQRRMSNKMIADVLEGIMGAIYLDSDSSTEGNGKIFPPSPSPSTNPMVCSAGGKGSSVPTSSEALLRVWDQVLTKLAIVDPSDKYPSMTSLKPNMGGHDSERWAREEEMLRRDAVMQAVEDALGYRFQCHHLLLEAVTHASLSIDLSTSLGHPTAKPTDNSDRHEDTGGVHINKTINIG